MSRWRTHNNRRRSKERKLRRQRWGVAAAIVGQGQFATLGVLRRWFTDEIASVTGLPPEVLMVSRPFRLPASALEAALRP